MRCADRALRGIEKPLVAVTRTASHERADAGAPWRSSPDSTERMSDINAQFRPASVRCATSSKPVATPVWPTARAPDADVRAAYSNTKPAPAAPTDASKIRDRL
jgi:hypothetical protein